MPLVFEKCCLPASFVEKTFSVRSRLFFIVRHGLGLSGQKLPSAQTVFRRIRIRYHAKSNPLEDERPFTDSSGCRPCVRRRPQHCLCADDASGKGLGRSSCRKKGGRYEGIVLLFSCFCLLSDAAAGRSFG